jgi:hypothetical protein
MRIEQIEKDRAMAAVSRIYEAIEREGRPVTNMLKVLGKPPRRSGLTTSCRGHCSRKSPSARP